MNIDNYGKNNKIKKSSENSKKYRQAKIESLKVTIERKKQCNSKALEVVTSFSEGTISEEILIENLQFINQEHYQDITEERAISKLCGYPLCTGKLKNIPTKQYHISTIHNKVFDITDRKNFCSNLCYKASKYLKHQIPTSPLWLRENNQITPYRLISLQSKGGIAGDEVDFGIPAIKTDVEDITSTVNEHSDTSVPANSSVDVKRLCSIKRFNESSSHVNEFITLDGMSSQHSLEHNLKNEQLENSDICLGELNLTYEKPPSQNYDQLPSESCEVYNYTNRNTVVLTENCNNKIDILNGSNMIISNLDQSNREDNNETRAPSSIDVSHKGNICEHSQMHLYAGVNKNKTDKCFNSLINFGSNNLTSESADVNADTERSKNTKLVNKSQILKLSKSNKPDNTAIDKDVKTCKSTSKTKMDKKIHQNEVSPIQAVIIKIEQVLKEWFSMDALCFVFGEEKVKEMLSEKKGFITDSNNTADCSMDPHLYERYLAICKKLNILELEDIKMDASFREEVKKPVPDFEALKEEAKNIELKVKMFYKGDKVVQFEESTQDKKTGDGEKIICEPVLPLVDLHAQKALRRRIVIDKLRKVLQDLQKSLGLRGFSLYEDLRSLVSTFTLSAHNITMKPAEWNLIAIVIIKLLSIKEKTLDQALQSKATNKHLTLLLMSYSLDGGYLDRLIMWLTDVDAILKKQE